MQSGDTVLVTGATGFVGKHLVRELMSRGYRLRLATRDVAKAKRIHADDHLADAEWVPFDAFDTSTHEVAFQGAKYAFYLLHSMSEGGDYEQREEVAAQNFRESAARYGLERIVYLGGTRPSGPPSKHLRSRLRTGEILRHGKVPVVELRASMIMGEGSESFRMVRDLSTRLPAMILPRWLKTESQPIGIDDVVCALCDALKIAEKDVGTYNIPGPEILRADQILFRLASLRGTKPFTISVPLITPRLSSYWIQLVTRSNKDVARELVEGLRYDLVSRRDSFWEIAPHTLLSFDEAASRALTAEESELPTPTRWIEQAIQRVSRNSF